MLFDLWNQSASAPSSRMIPRIAAPVAIACPTRRDGWIDGATCCGVENGWAIRNHLNEQVLSMRRTRRRGSLIQIEPLAGAGKRQDAAPDHVMRSGFRLARLA